MKELDSEFPGWTRRLLLEKRRELDSEQSRRLLQLRQAAMQIKAEIKARKEALNVAAEEVRQKTWTG